MRQNFFVRPTVFSVGLRADLRHANAVPVAVTGEDNFLAGNFYVKQRAWQGKFASQVVAGDLQSFFRADKLRELYATGRASVVGIFADCQFA